MATVTDSCLARLQSRTNPASMLQIQFLQAVYKLKAKSSGMQSKTVSEILVNIYCLTQCNISDNLNVSNTTVTSLLHSQQLISTQRVNNKQFKSFQEQYSHNQVLPAGFVQERNDTA